MGILVFKFKFSEGDVKYSCERECNLETDITGCDADGALEPQLVHTGDNKAERQDDSCNGSCSPGQTSWDVPYGVVISAEITFPEVVVLDNENGSICTCPVTNQREEVG